MVGVIIDRFGKDIPIRKLDEEHFEANVEVAVSPQFLGWIASLNPSLYIAGPESVLEEMKRFTEELARTYCRD